MRRPKFLSAAVVFLLLAVAIVPLLLPHVMAQEKITFVMAYPSDIGEMNPLFARSARTTWFLMQLYDTLIAYDTEMEPIPWLADSWEASDGFKTFTFHLRDGVTWHDGETLDAEDVKFTYDYVKQAPEDAVGWSILQKVVSTEVVDPLTVRVTFEEPMGLGLNQLGDFNIIPKHIWEGVAADDERWDDPDDVTAHIGSGPFVFKERVPDEYILMEKNEDWWGSAVYQEPFIDVLRIDVVRGQAARILAMRRGVADTERYEVFGTDVNTVVAAPELSVITGVASQWDYVLGFNLTIPGLDDVRVRKAIAHAMCREKIVTIARLGWGTSTYSVIPKSFFPAYHTDEGNFPDLPMIEGPAWEYVPAPPDESNRILDEAGYIDVDGDGIREFPGDPTKELSYDMMTLGWDWISNDAGAAIAELLKPVGIKLEVAITDDAVMYPALYAIPRDWRVYEMSHGYGTVPDHVYYRMHSDNDIDWGDNCYGLHDAEMDAAIDAMLHATSEEDKIAAAAEIQRLAIELIPYIPLFLSDDTHAIRKEWIIPEECFVPGGPFTAMAKLTMIYIHKELPPTPTTAPPITPAPTTPPPPGVNWAMVGGVAVVCLVVGAVVGLVVTRRS